MVGAVAIVVNRSRGPTLTECSMKFSWSLILICLLAGPDTPCQAAEPQRSGEKPVLKAHKNHVRKTSAEYLAAFRRITWHYDFATAAELARETGRPMFVIFCRAGSIIDPLSGKPKCAS